MNKKQLLPFLIRAREHTYAGGKGEVKPAFAGSHQLEYKEKDFLYRDLYNMGNKIFVGLETVYFQKKPVWSMSYFGNFQKMTEKEVDNVLRKALIEKKDKARLWHKVEWKKGEYQYLCIPDGSDSIDELGGSEEIYKGKEKVYFFYYAGGFIG